MKVISDDWTSEEEQLSTKQICNQTDQTSKQANRPSWTSKIDTIISEEVKIKIQA